MTPANFPQANSNFGPPPELVESQCHTIPAYRGDIERGSCEGVRIVVVAWKPSRDEMQELLEGGLIYLSCLGGLVPHFLTTNFEQATHPA